MNWNYTAHTMLGQKVLEERTKRNRNMKKRESAWPAWHSDYSEQEKPLPENHAAQLRRLQRMNSWYYTKHDMIGDIPYEEMDCEDMYTSGYDTVTSENWISRLMARIFGIGMPEQMHA